MSNREKCISLLDRFTETQLVEIAIMLQATSAVAAEANDDAYCEQLLAAYTNDSDGDSSITEEELLSELGIEL